MKELETCPKCGGNVFRARQNVDIAILVNSKGDFQENVEGIEATIENAGNPFGPFVCLVCGKEYPTLPVVIEDKGQ